MKQAGIRRHLWSLGVSGALALAVALGPVSGSRAGAQPAPPPPPPVPNATLTPLGVPTAAASPLPSDVPVPTAAPSAAPATLAPSAGPAASPLPSESPAPRGRRRHRGSGASASPAPATSSAPEPTATPTSPAFATLDGTWEVQLQYIDRTEYSYVTLVQTTGGALTGTWRMGGRKNAVSYPLTGNYDGRLIRLTATEPTGPVNFSGYVEGASDMIGLATFPTTPSSSPSPGASAVPSTPPGALSPVAPTNANDGVAFTAEHRGTPNHSVIKR